MTTANTMSPARKAIIWHEWKKGESSRVHFQAIYRLNLGWGYLQENSEFVREDVQ